MQIRVKASQRRCLSFAFVECPTFVDSSSRRRDVLNDVDVDVDPNDVEIKRQGFWVQRKG